MNKKVLLIATVQSHIAQFHKTLMRLLKNNGWEIHVAARDNLAEKNGLQLEYPDKVFNIPFQRSPFDKRNYTAYKLLKKLLNEEHYDVIHCNTPVGGMIGRIVGNQYRKYGTRVFYTAHGFHFYKGAPFKNWLIYYPIEKWMSWFTDILITITDEDYNLAKKKFHCKVFRIHGVGVDENRYCPVSDEEKQRLKTEMCFEGPVILNVGELLPNKNHKMAIDMMVEVVKKYPTARLLIAGNGPEKDNLEKYINEMGVAENILLIGYRTNLQDYQHIADVLVACSYREGLPLNLVEAMLSKTVVVASKNRGHRELIKNEITGYLVNGKEDMAEKVISIISNPSPIIRDTAYDYGLLYSSSAVRSELSKIYCVTDSFV